MTRLTSFAGVSVTFGGSLAAMMTHDERKTILLWIAVVALLLLWILHQVVTRVTVNSFLIRSRCITAVIR
jgi:hypothetical protein